MPKISALPAMTTPVATDDQIPIHDVSAGATKRIDDGDLTGFPDYGWTTAAETWTYSSWSSTTRIGVITVPTDATTKYSVGYRIQITQSTGGTKYGIITAVSATTITVFFPTSTTLNNETISTPFYSSVKIPFGFPASPTSWMLSFSDTSDRSQSSPTQNTWYNLGTATLALGIGSWRLFYEVTAGSTRSAAVTLGIKVTLSTANNSESDKELTSYGETAGSTTNLVDHYATFHREKLIDLVAATSYYLNLVSLVSSATSINTYGSTYGTTKIRAICGYL